MSELIPALLLGISYGIGPCTLSCAPIVVPLIMSTANSKKEGVIHSIIFGLGRVLGYIIIGFFAGLLGREISFFVSKPLLGVFFVLMGVAIILKVKGRCVYKSKYKITGKFMALIAGIMYGLGPCPPLIALIGIAALSQSAILGSVLGLVFGIGTLLSPLILLGFLSGWFSKQQDFKPIIPYVSGAFIIIMGVIYVFT